MAALKFDCPRCGAELTDNYDCSGCSGSFKAEIQANTVDETLTSGQTDAQDFMDNVCQELLPAKCRKAPGFIHGDIRHTFV